MKKIVLMLTLLGMAVSSFGVPTIDGVKGADWAGVPVQLDPDQDRVTAGLGQTLDLREWAVTSDGTNLYSWFYADNFATYSGDNWFASTQIDLDRTAGTAGSSQLSTNGGGGQFPDTSGPELGDDAAGNAAVIGPDIWAEWGGQIANGDEGFNFWGKDDNCQVSDWSAGSPPPDRINPADQEGGALTAWLNGAGQGIEYSTPISRIASQLTLGTYDNNGLMSSGTGPGSKNVWKIGMRLAGHLVSGGGWDGDKSGNAVDPSGSAAINKRTVYVPINTLWGDANTDGTVSGADLSALAFNYGTFVGYTGDTWAMGDFNADGTVSGADLSIMALNYGLTYGAGGEVPEPVSLVLLALGAVGIIRRK